LNTFSKVLDNIKRVLAEKSQYSHLSPYSTQAYYYDFLYQTSNFNPEPILDFLPELALSIQDLSPTEFDIIGFDYFCLISEFIPVDKLEQPRIFQRIFHKLSWEIIARRAISFSDDFYNFSEDFLDQIIAETNTTPSVASDLRKIKGIILSKSPLGIFS
jgi:hypothetical protein